MSVMWFSIGVLVAFILEFIFNRAAEKVNKKAGESCGYDCDTCSAHCVGYHCHLQRNQKIVDAAMTEDDV